MNLNDEFVSLISEELTPVMKVLGFKKQNLNYHRNTHDVIQTFSIQKSQYNDKNSLKFTGNIGLTEPVSFSKIHKLSVIPSQVKDYESQFRLRLGNLTENKDYWYEMTDRIDITTVKNKFRTDIATLKNFFDAYSTRNGLLELLENQQILDLPLNPLDEYGILKVSGKDQEARALFMANYNKLKEPTLLGKGLKWIKGIISERELSLDLIRQKRHHYEEIGKIFGESLN